MLETKSNQLEHRYGPWPQPSPHHPVGESPSVLNLKCSDWIDWWSHIGLRYIVTLCKFPFYYIVSLLDHKIKEVPDDEFVNILTDGVFSKFLLPLKSVDDLSMFKNEIDQNRGAEFFIVDLSAMKTVTPYKGQYTAVTKTLLKKAGKSYQVLAIYFENQFILPNIDDERWVLAKYYVLQGLAICTTLVSHPVLHFPMDTINAVTRTYLPISHPIAKLLKPHSRFSLSLSFAVLDFKSSVINNKWWMVYAPYPGPKEGLRELIVAGYRGIEGNANYPEYKYPKSPTRIYSGYGEYLDCYYQVFYEFVGNILKEVKINDPMLVNWANYISMWIPGFPNGNEIAIGDNLQRALAYFIFDVSLAHSSDHYLFSLADMQKIPLRIRVSMPDRDSKKRISFSRMFNAIDLTKYKMAMTLFFGPTAVTRLMETNYQFGNKKLEEYEKQFFDQLRNCEKNLKVKNYMPLEEATASIQY